MMTTTLALGFLVPGLAIAGAVAVSIPVIIHILSKRPRKPREWAAMRFLLAAYKRHRMRTQLEQLLLLLCRCLIVLLLGLALAGPLLSALGALGDLASSGRVVVIVLDDSVTGKAVDPQTGKSRFDTMKATALKLIDGMSQGDRVGLVTTSRPASAVVSPPTNDPTAVRKRIDQMEATDARSDIGAALRVAQQSLDEMEVKSRATYVALLSDFMAGQAAIDQALPEQLKKMGETATLLRPAPGGGLANVQIGALRPDRRAVIRQSAEQTATVTWNIRVKRFSPVGGGGAPAGEMTTLRLSVPQAPLKRHTITWAAGQTEAEVRIDTPLGETGELGAEAVIEQAAAGSDALDADDTRRALVRVRQKVTVLIVDDPGPDTADLTPRKWLTTALAPVADTWGWPIEIKRQDPATIDTDSSALGEADAVYVLRPDLLDARGWAAIKKWIGGGGLAWFVAPREPGTAIWATKLSETFALGWAIGGDPVEHDPAIGMKTDAPAPLELARLTADLPDLLRAITVSRRLPIDRASLGGRTDVVMTTIEGEPLAIAATLPDGGGRIMLLGTSVDIDWTNLPTKPLFVPLVHESLLAAIDLLQPDHAFEPGDQPALGAEFERIPSLKSPDGQNVMLVRSAVDAGDAGSTQVIRPIKPLSKPGLYTAETATLAVNVAAEAGDTLATDGAMLDAWLNAIGAWKPIDRKEPAAVFAQQAEEADLSWPLLWAVLVLAVIETLLARYVSHSSARRTDSVAEMPGMTRKPA